MNLSKVALLVGLVAVATSAGAQSLTVELEALLGKTAVVKIDGQRKTLRVGESVGEVTLVSTQATTATLQINGKSETIGLSERVGTSFEQPEEHVVTIARDTMMQYQTTAIINGRSAPVLVDTGANTVAISSQQARAMGIDYGAEEPTQVVTASGVSDGYPVMLQSVLVGGIRVDNVPAVVVMGAYPEMILLGMSYLQHVKLQEHNGILSLSATR